MGGILVIMLGLFLFLAVVVFMIALGLAAAIGMFQAADQIHQQRVGKS